MTSTPTEQFISKVISLKAGALSQLRFLAGMPLDASVDGFDLFAGLWWPLRQTSPKAPRREVAWLIAKLYAVCPLPFADGATFAKQLGKLPHVKEGRRQQRFDELLLSALSGIEPAMQWGLAQLSDNDRQLDWVRLTDDLSAWEREGTRLKWSREYLGLS